MTVPADRRDRRHLRRRHQDQAPVRITTAPQNANDDLDHRRRRYLLSMTIRTLCFIGALFVGAGWLRWALIVGAVFLPYVAVVMANTGDPRIEGSDLLEPHSEHKELH